MNEKLKTCGKIPHIDVYCELYRYYSMNGNDID